MGGWGVGVGNEGLFSLKKECEGQQNMVSVTQEKTTTGLTFFHWSFMVQ